MLKLRLQVALPNPNPNPNPKPNPTLTRPKHPDWTYVHVPDTAEGPVTWNPEEGPDYVAPMMYYSNHNS